MNVDLILFSSTEQPSLPDWPLGKVWVAQPDISALNELTNRILTQTGACFFWSIELGQPNLNLITTLLSGPADIYHAGLKMGMGGLPHSIDYVAPTWMLNCDPPMDIEATSWRMSLDACLVRVDVLWQMGFLRSEFNSLDAAVLEWGHRCIRRGVIMRHVPGLVQNPIKKTVPVLSFEDELRFIRLRFGKKWQLWTSFRALATRRSGLRSVFQVNKMLMREVIHTDPVPYQHVNKVPVGDVNNVKVSVLLPTVDRYPYLKVILDQLRSQTQLPHEIIVVDQTAQDDRDELMYGDFADLPLKVIFLDEIGQCSSRNAGLSSASGEYILFLDDDDEIDFDLISKHLQHLRMRYADVSSGVANEIGTGALPVDFTFARMSDVFPTNNSMICRDVLTHSGLFDLAYDHGARADADLGMRMYQSGALMMLNPAISVLHHHAPRGGLRLHKARVVTYAASRASLVKRNIPSATEIYMMHRYFQSKQIRESLWLSVFSSLILAGPLWKRIVKVFVGILLLPSTLLQLNWNIRQAGVLSKQFPMIPIVQSLEVQK